MPKVTVVTLPVDILPVSKKSAKVTPESNRTSYLWRTSFPQAKGWLFSLVYRDNLPFNGLAFLLARVSVLDELFPFGLAFLAAMVQVSRKQVVAASFWSLAGIVSMGNYRELIVYFVAMLLYSPLVNQLKRLQTKLIAAPLAVFISVLSSGLIASLWYSAGATPYNLLLVLFEAAMCVVLTQVFMYAAIGFHGPTTEYRKSETLLCALIVLSIAAAGLGDLALWGYSLRNIAGSLLVMELAMIGSAGMGAAAGVVVGLVMGLAGGNVPYAVALYSLAGTLGGLFQRLGRFAVPLGYILGVTITVSYWGQDRDVALVLTEGVIGVVAFILLSFSQVGSRLQDLIPSGNTNLGEELLLPDAADKLQYMAGVFNDLSAAFADRPQDMIKKNDGKKHLSECLSAVTEQVCHPCHQQEECWKHNFYRTYQDLLLMMGLAEEGRLQVEIVSAEMKQRCAKYREIADLMTMLAENKRINYTWKKEIAGTRQMISGQLKATGNIIHDLSREILRQPQMDGKKAAVLQHKAALLECNLDSVHITGKRGSEVVEVSKLPCAGVRECLHTILPLTAGLMQEKMTLHAECGDSNQQRRCRLTMRVSSRFGVQAGLAAMAKDGGNVSGDSYSLTQLNRGKVALLLSDGMGSGKEAADESLAAVHFLQRLLAVGFDVGLAVKTLNSLLVLRLPDETFATIDMAVIDTYSGEVEFIKVGSAPSFVKRVREVLPISEASLPIGVFPHIEIQPVKIMLSPGDLIVMVSDGVADVSRQGLEKECWIANSLRCNASCNPQEVANDIFQQALQRAEGKVRDDMTVLVVKITEKPEWADCKIKENK